MPERFSAWNNFLYSDDDDEITDNDITVNDVINNEQTIDLTVEDSCSSINGDIPPGAKQEQNSPNLETGSHDHNHAGSHDHNYALETHIDITRTSKKHKVTVNGLSYKRLLEKEESEENTIVMEDLAVDETSSVTIEHKSRKFSNFMVKLKLIKSQVASTFLILLSLLR